MDENPDKLAVISQLQSERELFEQVLARIPEDWLDTEPVIDDWTVKDILAHLFGWEAEFLRWMDLFVRGEDPDLPHRGAWGPYIQAFNQRNFSRYREWLLGEVLTEFNATFIRFLDRIQHIPQTAGDRDWSAWHGAQPPWGLILSFAEHYTEHRHPVEAWLNKKKEVFPCEF